MGIVFHEPTVDSLFHHLMGYQEVRNSLLSAILGEEITHSELTDVLLNPFPTFKALREVVNRPGIKELLEEIDVLPESLASQSEARDSLSDKALKFIQDLAPLHAHLSAVIPSPERESRLDIVCRSTYGLINVEMQVRPQNFWDLRILDYVCGLFHRQFYRGFKWKDLECDESVSEKISRVVGISLLAKAPRYPENVQAFLPWYQLKPFGKTELSRHYRLCDKNESNLVRPGIEFFDFNLEAFLVLHAQKGGLDAYPKALCEWLDFFARAPTKTLAEVEAEQCSEPVRKAYEIIRELPPELGERYAKDLFEYANISHYVQGTREMGKAEGRAEGEVKLRAEKLNIAKNLLAIGQLSVEQISAVTGLSVAEIIGLKS